MSLRSEAKSILGVMIPKNGWSKVFADLDERGKVNQKQLGQLLLLLMQHVEALEEKPSE